VSRAAHAAEQRRSSVSECEEEKGERPSPVVPTRGIRPASPCGMVATRGVRSSGRLRSGPHPIFIISRIFNHLNFKIQIDDLPPVQNSPNFVGSLYETHGTTLLFGPTSKSNWITSSKFRNKFKFEYFYNFIGVQTFMEKSDKFSKILASHSILEYEIKFVFKYWKFLYK
jgi:hypothetical protein